MSEKKHKKKRVPKVLQDSYRRSIRYIMFKLKSDIKNDLNENQLKIYDAVRDYYSSLPDFGGWDKFSETWDIGTDDDNVLNNWEDPSRSDKWWTWGISRFKIVKRVGLTYVINKEEGITKSFPGIMEYFVALGFAKPDGKGSYRLDVKKMMLEVETRDKWTPLIETDHSLKDFDTWQQHYYKDDTILNEFKEKQ